MLRLSERNLKFPIWDNSDYPSKEHPPVRVRTLEPKITRLCLRNNFINNIEDYWRALLERKQVNRDEYLRFVGTTLPDTRIGGDIYCNLTQISGGKVSNRGYLMI